MGRGIWGIVGDWGVSGPVLEGTGRPGHPLGTQAPAMAGAYEERKGGGFSRRRSGGRRQAPRGGRRRGGQCMRTRAGRAFGAAPF